MSEWSWGKSGSSLEGVDKSFVKAQIHSILPFNEQLAEGN